MINVSTELLGDELAYNDIQSIYTEIEDMPDIWVNPDEFQITMTPGTITNRILTIGNSGTQDLEYVLTCPWFEDLDSYSLGSSIHGQGGWEGWLNNPSSTAYVSNAQSSSPPHSVDISGSSDLVHSFSGYDSGTWTFTAWQYIPSSFSGKSYFIMLGEYESYQNWALQVTFDGSTNLVESRFLFCINAY